MTHVTRSEQETFALGAELGARLTGGEVVFLIGEFGCGKTVFAKGIASALGIAPASVTSPSFVLVQSYQGRLLLHHADLYRITTREAVEELVLEELVSPGSVLVVEWAQHWAAPALEATYRVAFQHEAPESRRIDIEPGL